MFRTRSLSAFAGLALVAVLGLSACGSDSSSDAPADTPTTVMTESTDVMTESTDVMTESTDVMTESTDAMAESTDAMTESSETTAP